MPNMYVDTRKLTKAIGDVVAEVAGYPVGYGRSPINATTGNPESFPYIVITKLDTDKKSFKGPSYVAPEADECVRYVISSFGERHDQVEWLQNKVKEAIIGRVVGHGMFLYDISLDDHSITQRSLGLEGKINPEGTTFSADDIYEFEVTSQV